MAPFITNDHKKALRAVYAGIKYRYGIEEADLLSASRDQTIVRARQLAWYALRERFGLTYPLMASVFGKDHTTVLHGVEVIRSRGLQSAALELLDQPMK